MTNIEKGLSFSLICLAIFVITLLIALDNQRSEVTPYEAKIMLLQGQIDTLHHRLFQDSLSAQKLIARQDSLSDQANLQNRRINLLRQRYQQTLRQYASLRQYDSLSAADIRQYLSDSIP